MKSSNMVEAMNPPEGIYIHIQKPTVPRYMSQFRPTVVLESVKNKEAQRTMGPAKLEVSVPDKYLKKHSKEPRLPELSTKFVRTNCAGKKPAVPARPKNAPVVVQTKRDPESSPGECIQTTKVAPKKPEPIFVDTRKGHKQPIENSGLVPKHINKKNFGAVPEYVLRRNEEKQRAREEYDEFLKRQQEQEAKKKWTDAEQKNILKGLKSWEKSHPEFQSLPTITDLISQNKNRERVDMEMKRLEDEVNLVERFRTACLPEHEDKARGLRFTQLYMSKSRPTIALESVKNKEAKRTMGPVKVEASVPDKYLKKHSQEPKLPERTQSLTFARTIYTEKKQSDPGRTDNAPVDVQTKRDQEGTTGECTPTTKVAPKKPESIFVDTRKGHKQPIENSGLVPKYLKKKDYGAVPEYVLERIKENQKAWGEYDKFLKEQQEQEAKKKLSYAERKTILLGLKMKWAKLNHEFQGLPFITDTLHLKKNRVRVEMEMKRLEDDINLIERFQIIYLPVD